MVRLRAALPCELPTNCRELPTSRGGGLRIAEPAGCQRGDQYLRHDETCVQLVVSGHDVPRGVPSARRAQACFIRLHVPGPVAPLFNVLMAELPVLALIVNPRNKPAPLFTL